MSFCVPLQLNTPKQVTLKNELKLTQANTKNPFGDILEKAKG